MIESSISVGNAEELVLLLGTKDQHLRQIRGAIPAKISTRDGNVVIQGEEDAVVKATAVLEELRATVGRQGPLDAGQVAQIIHRVTGNGDALTAAPIDIRNGRKIRPRTTGQAAYVQAIRSHDLVLCAGPAGTGKTYLAVATAVEALKEQTIRKIVLVRPAVEAGESLGFLPGDLQAKINPYLRPLLDALREMMDAEQVRRYMDDDVIEVVPLAYMRGRTLNNAFIIMDEAQNTTVAQMKMFLTRMGEGSKVVVSGDVSQIDLPSHAKSGLVDALHRLRGIEGTTNVKLSGSDIVRHRLVQEIVKAYEDGAQMSTGPQKRTRQQRVAAVELPPGFWKKLWFHLQRGGVLLRLGLCAVAALFLWGFTRGWDPPFSYRLDEIVRRSLVARVDFKQPDPDTTDRNRRQAHDETIATYDQNPEPLVQLRAKLRTEIGNLLAAKTLTDADAAAWQKFLPTPAPGTPDSTAEEREAQFQRFREAFASEASLETFNEQVEEAMAPLEQQGLIASLPPEHNANSEKIWVRSVKSPTAGAQVNIADVLITDEAGARLQKSLNDKLSNAELASLVFAWLRPQLPTTLTLNGDVTKKDQDEQADAVEDAYIPREKDVYVIAKAGETINPEKLALLHLEYEAEIADRTVAQRIGRSAAVLGMFVALYTLSGFYLYVRDRRALDELLRLITLLGLMVLTVSLAAIVNWYAWGADIIPLLLFAMIVAVAYQQEMALLLSACITLVVVVSLGHGLSQAMVWSATIAGAVLVLRQVRTRSKLLMVGFTAGAVGFFTTLGVGTLYGQDVARLLQNGFTVALWSVIAGSLMTVLLPTVEKIFGVQTDLSLIELGDPAHPLLQELIRRAPGTYNHSITVASLAEAAAEAIGARGLLVGVGAYFHDIGKMLKPQYFIENQSKGDNRHDTLVPAMSTLVIIAHVKDGADLARQNRLPESIVDFIQQHHGTTLVEFFYRQANQKKVQEDPDAGVLDESSFRYPGPKPQTREAGVLMLADAVESASRVLKEPTPSRIENLVDELSMKRLLDGQFDESGLTLEEVRKIGESLVKSLTAVYHGRVKYPDQVTA